MLIQSALPHEAIHPFGVSKFIIWYQLSGWREGVCLDGVGGVVGRQPVHANVMWRW